MYPRRSPFEFPSPDSARKLAAIALAARGDDPSEPAQAKHRRIKRSLKLRALLNRYALGIEIVQSEIAAYGERRREQLAALYTLLPKLAARKRRAIVRLVRLFQSDPNL